MLFIGECFTVRSFWTQVNGKQGVLYLSARSIETPCTG